MSGMGVGLCRQLESSKNHDFPNLPFKRWTSKAELSDFISIFTGA